jgi:glutamyl-tRNA synthetase
MLNWLTSWWRKPIRVRIAPSPTGYLHIGTARTALFNWLFAKKHGGKFVLRIEDTDLERSEKRFEDDILAGLAWLGITWDEGPKPAKSEEIENPKPQGQNYIGNYGPYRQTERLDIYEKYLKKLLEMGLAYYCDCTKESLETERKIQMEKGEAPRYNGKCRARNVSPESAYVIRFKINPGQISFHDLIRGPISFDTSLIGDIAIAKNLQTPLYNFAVVIDDYEMRISHVIRGEDHIANTPKQMLLQKALGFPHPQYAHLPLILDPDRSKMSKRYSATSIQEYRKIGYLPNALINFIALLGWHPAGGEARQGRPTEDKEKMSLEEIVSKFELERIQKGGAIFDTQKLDWLNAEYIKETSPDILAAMIEELYGPETLGEKDTALKILETSRSRMARLEDFKNLRHSFDLIEYDPKLLIWKSTPKEKILANLTLTQELVRSLLVSEFTQKQLEAQIMPLANTNGRGEVLWPLRVSLSGQEKSPGPFEIMAIIGKEESLKRIQIGIKKLTV